MKTEFFKHIGAGFIILTLIYFMQSCGKNVTHRHDNNTSNAINQAYYTCSQQLYPTCVMRVSRNLLTGQYFYSEYCYNQYINCVR